MQALEEYITTALYFLPPPKPQRGCSHVLFDPYFENIPGVIEEVFKDEELTDLWNYFMDKKFDAEDNQETFYGRCLIWYGTPLKGYANQDDRADKQRDINHAHIRDHAQPIIKDPHYFLDTDGDGEEERYDVVGMRVVYTGGFLIQEETIAQVFKDLALAGGSMTFVFIIMLLQTQSWFIAGIGMASIFGAFLGANLFYRIMFQFIYFGIFHVLAIFIILGIGADDIFVFMDTWGQSALEESEISDNLANRLSWTYRRAGKAMLVTSLTTCAAFVANCFTELLAIQSFGLFAALLVAINYMSIVTFFPCVVCMYDQYWHGCQCCCPFCGGCAFSSPTSRATVGCWCCKGVNKTAGAGISKEKELGTVEAFFHNEYWQFLTAGQNAKLLLIGFGVLFVIMVSFAAQLGVEKEGTKLWKPGSNWQDVQDLPVKYLAPNSDTPSFEITIAWGLKNQDRSSCHRTDLECVGEIVWDDSFDLNPIPAQLTILELCETLRAMPTTDAALFVDLAIRSESGTTDPIMTCFMEDIRTYWNTEIPPVNDTGGGFPLQATTFDDLARYDVSPYNDTNTYYRWFEVGLLETMALDQYYDKWAALVGGQTEDPVKYGHQMKYVAIRLKTLLAYPVGYPEGLPVHDFWEEYMKLVNAEILGPSVNKAFQLADNVQPGAGGYSDWMQLKVQKTLVSSAISGIAIGMTLAFIVLTCATMNVLIAFLATWTIVNITVCVLGVIKLAGWRIGVLESLNITMVVGLSVDYVVHIAEAFIESHHDDRNDKVRDALTEVGISVLSGAVTTLGASAFMFAAKILFFYQFGIFIFVTILFSILWAVGFFPCICIVMGPNGQHGSMKGDLHPYMHKLRDKLQELAAEEEDEDEMMEMHGGPVAHGQTSASSSSNFNNSSSSSYPSAAPYTPPAAYNPPAAAPQQQAYNPPQNVQGAGYGGGGGMW